MIDADPVTSCVRWACISCGTQNHWHADNNSELTRLRAENIQLRAEVNEQSEKDDRAIQELRAINAELRCALAKLDPHNPSLARTALANTEK